MARSRNGHGHFFHSVHAVTSDGHGSESRVKWVGLGVVGHQAVTGHGKNFLRSQGKFNGHNINNRSIYAVVTTPCATDPNCMYVYHITQIINV